MIGTVIAEVQKLLHVRKKEIGPNSGYSSEYVIAVTGFIGNSQKHQGYSRILRLQLRAAARIIFM